MKKHFYSLALAAVVILTGCNKNEVLNTEGKININTGIEAITRAPQLDENGAGTFAKGDKLNLLAFNGAKQHTDFDYTIGTTELYWNDIKVASDNGKINFAACYPSQELNEGKFVFDLEKASDKDLLLAYTENIENGTEKAVMLTFKHAMHRLVINYTVDNSYQTVTADEIVTDCTALSTCTVNLLEKTVATENSPKATFSAKEKSTAFLIAPQNAADVTLKVTAGTDTNTCTLDKLVGSNLKLESGKQLELNLLVKEGKIILEGFTIEGWENQGSIDGDIIM